MEAKGLKRIILEITERLTYKFATKILCNSYGLRDYIKRNIMNIDVEVLHNGSIKWGRY